MTTSYNHLQFSFHQPILQTYARLGCGLWNSNFGILTAGLHKAVTQSTVSKH